MSDDEDELFEYAKKLDARGAVYAAFFKGVSGEDKHIEEREISRKVLVQLGLTGFLISSEPEGRDKSPDVCAQFENGEMLGIEVVELVDRKMRERQIKRRKAEIEKGLSSLDAFHAEFHAFEQARSADLLGSSESFYSAYARLHPTWGKVSRFSNAQWDLDRTAKEILELIQKKDKKLSDAKLSGRYNECVLIIHTGEMCITTELLDRVANVLTIVPQNIDRVFALKDYDPSIKRCPLIRLI